MPSNIWRPWGEPSLARIRPNSVWLKPLVKQLKNESAIKVIGQLEEALVQLPGGPAAEAVQREVNYFHEHEDRMDYRAGRRRGEPVAAARWKPPAGRTSAASNVPDSSGVRPEMKPCCVWKPSGATIAGTFYFPTPHSTLHETEMRTLQAEQILAKPRGYRT